MVRILFLAGAGSFLVFTTSRQVLGSANFLLSEENQRQGDRTVTTHCPKSLAIIMRSVLPPQFLDASLSYSSLVSVIVEVNLVLTQLIRIRGKCVN